MLQVFGNAGPNTFLRKYFSKSVRGLFGLCSRSVRGLFGTKFSEPKIQNFKNFQIMRRRPHKYAGVLEPHTRVKLTWTNGLVLLSLLEWVFVK